LVLRVERTVRILPDLSAASEALATELFRLAAEAVSERGRFRWVISGGRTPLLLFELLAGPLGRAMPWRKTEVFFADERCVPPDHPDSNFGAAYSAFLSKVPISPARVHRIRGEVRPASRAASDYGRVVGPVPGPEQRGAPRFDAVLLGIGPDGHTASLFPNASVLDERRRPVVAIQRAGQPPFVPRVTMTLRTLSSTRGAFFLVSGRDKAGALRAILAARREGTARWPASLVRSTGTVHWYVDRDAASDLSDAPPFAPRT
jgi:6-phosphogluconolactonase